MRQLGKSKAKAEKVGQPKVVSSHPGVCFCLYLLLVYKAPGCLALQVFMHVSRPVDPAVLVGIRRELLPCLAQDCLYVQVVLHKHEDEAHHDDEGGHLVVEFEEGSIDLGLVTSEPFHHFGYDWKLVNYSVRRHFSTECVQKNCNWTVELLSNWPNLPGLCPDNTENLANLAKTSASYAFAEFTILCFTMLRKRISIVSTIHFQDKRNLS